MFVPAFFRTRSIHTLYSLVLFVYLCRPLECLGVLLCLWVLFLERGVFTHLFYLFICIRLIISVHGYFTAVTVRHKPSQITAVHANLATRLGSSRSANFFRGRCTYLKFTSTIPFHDMTSGVTVETVGNDL